MKVVKVTSKGRVTIPVEVRTALGIDEGSHLEVSEDGESIRLRKVVRARPLSEDDPIWQLVGAGESGYADVAENHDRHLADLSLAGATSFTIMDCLGLRSAFAFDPHFRQYGLRVVGLPP